jgi:hypothetical protein
MKTSRKTIFFEKHYKIDINDLKSTVEIDEVVEKKIGRKLRVVKTDVLL